MVQHALEILWQQFISLQLNIKKYLYIFNHVTERGGGLNEGRSLQYKQNSEAISNPTLGILYKTLTACLKRTKVGYLCHNIKHFPYTNKMGKPRSYSQHTVLVEFIHILAAMLPCTCYSDTQHKQKKIYICTLCSDVLPHPGLAFCNCP
jgi:hypothetical protein